MGITRENKCLNSQFSILLNPARDCLWISDQGGAHEIQEAEEPDLEAKLEGLQKPRGWGLYLIRNMVDDVRVSSDGDRHTVELVMRLEGGGDEGD